MMFLWYGGGEANDAFNINQSFNVLFMVIIGGLGSLIGAFFGAAFISGLPTLLKFGLPAIGIPIGGAFAEHLTYILVGWAHHLLPDRRAAWAGKALADREAEAPDLAVPLLNGRPG